MVKTLNQKIFTYDSTKDETVIPSTALLDEFIEDYETASVSLDKRSHYTNLQSTLGYPNITGSIYIANANGTAVNEEDISQVYNVIWPKLNIFVANVNESYVAKFVSRQDSGADTEIDIKRFSQSDNVSLTLQNITNKIPTKTNHTFLGWAVDPAGTKMVFDYQYNSSTGKWGLVDGAYAGSAEVTFSQANNIIILYAIFETEKYGLKFYDGDGTLLAEEGGLVTYINSVGETELVTKLVPYGSYIELPNAIAYKDDSALSLEEVYVLKGWASTDGGSVIKNITSRKVTSNMVFYPVFEVDNVHNNILPEEFLDIGQNNYRVGDEYGVLVKVKAGYTVRGKITIPATLNGKKIFGIYDANDNSPNGFYKNQNLTMIFWENGAVPDTIGTYAFAYSGLKYFEFKSSIEYIMSYAFYQLANANGGLSNRDLSVMSALQTINANAFNRAFSNSGGEITLPASVETIAFNAFRYNGEYGITGFILGNANAGSRLTFVGDGAFNPGFSGSYSVIVYVSADKENDAVWDTISAQVSSLNKVVI